MIKKLLIFGCFAALIGGGVGYYMWNKPHAEIGQPNFTTTATELAAEFTADESKATEKYVGSMDKMIVVQVSGTVASVENDTSGVSISLETGDPMNGVSCVLDKFTKQAKTDFKVGEAVTLKGICTGKLSDVVIDRCVQ
jgi:tRNA_anti-like